MTMKARERRKRHTERGRNAMVSELTQLLARAVACRRVQAGSAQRHQFGRSKHHSGSTLLTTKQDEERPVRLIYSLQQKASHEDHVVVVEGPLIGEGR